MPLETADIVEELQSVIDPALAEAKKVPLMIS